jgi:hypothetical protein
VRPSRSYRSGKRRRHKHATSPETARWERERRPPDQPGWADDETWQKLVAFRHRLELDG